MLCQSFHKHFRETRTFLISESNSVTILVNPFPSWPHPVKSCRLYIQNNPNVVISPHLQYHHWSPNNSNVLLNCHTGPFTGFLSSSSCDPFSYIAARGICILNMSFLCLSLQMSSIPLRIKSKLLYHLAYSLSSPTLFHPSCHPLHSSDTGLLKCAKHVPISGPLHQLFPLPGMLFTLTFARLAAFCRQPSSLQRSKESTYSVVVTQSLSHHPVLPLSA